MKRKEILLSLFRPQGTLLRYISSAYLIFSSVTVTLVYYSINYEICINDKCSNLLVNNNWVSLNPFLLILSGSIFLVSIFVFRSRSLSIIYSIALALGFSAATILSGKLLVLIQYEISIT